MGRKKADDIQMYCSPNYFPQSCGKKAEEPENVTAASSHSSSMLSTGFPRYSPAAGNIRWATSIYYLCFLIITLGKMLEIIMQTCVFQFRIHTYY
ncbi:hypothetical protein FKM82_001149 [Ascaphus truei]